MEFKNLSVKEMEAVVSFVGEEWVKFQSEDSHAWYFDLAEESDVEEYKVTKEDYSVKFKRVDHESWSPLDEVTEEVIKEALEEVFGQ